MEYVFNGLYDTVIDLALTMSRQQLHYGGSNEVLGC